MMQRTVLFVCIHNSARSQMAAAFLQQLGGEKFVAESAGLEPGVLNPYVVQVMREVGIDISNNATKGVFDLFKTGRKYDVVITVCDGASSERCPVFPGQLKRLAWEFPDPSSFGGTDADKLEGTRKVRDMIKAKIVSFIDESQEFKFWA
jgi:arsenate reductase (thioredoxin)